MIPRLDLRPDGPNDASLQVFPGEIVALLGANGAGKTTMLKAIMGFTARPGEIRLDGLSLAGVPPHRRSRLGIGYCPEGRRVFPRMSVRETLEVARRGPGTGKLAEIYALFPALADRRDTQAGQLSGGEQQMLAMGRALMTEPELLLLDEPSLGLSPRLTDVILGTLRAIAAGGAAILVAEQNAARALAVADRAYLLQLGRITREGEAAELRADPALTQAFLGG